jgi:hypothetical protein
VSPILKYVRGCKLRDLHSGYKEFFFRPHTLRPLKAEHVQDIIHDVNYKWLSTKTYPDLDCFNGTRPAGVLIELRADNGFVAILSTFQRIQIERRYNY